MLSQRMMLGANDRKTLLKSDSKRSLLTKSLSRSMIKLKNTVTQKGEDEEEEKVVSLMEYEMLKAKLHVSEGKAMQQKGEIRNLQMLLTEKDNVIDTLLQQLEAMSTANEKSAPALRGKGPPTLQRMTSLEEKRQKKRLMERAHSLGINRSPNMLRNGLQTLESVLGREGEMGNPSSPADSQQLGPISTTLVLYEKNPPAQDDTIHTQESEEKEAENRSKSPHRRPRQLTKQSSKRNFRRKSSTESLRNSRSSNADSKDLRNATFQPDKRAPTSSATEEIPRDRSKSPHRHRSKLTKQFSRRNNRRKNSVEAAEPPISPEATNLGSTIEATGPKVIPRDRLELNLMSPVVATDENHHSTEDAIRDRSKSPSNRRARNITKQGKARPSRRRSDESSQEAVRNFRRKLAGDTVNGGENRLMRNSRAQARSVKAREEMKQTDQTDGDTLSFASPRTSARRSRGTDRGESAADTNVDSAPGSRAQLPSTQTAPPALPNVPIFPVSMGIDFKNQGLADYFETDGKEQVQGGTDGFVAKFVKSPFATTRAINNDDQCNAESHQLEQGGIEQFKAGEGSPHEVVGTSGDKQKRSNGSNHDKSKSGHSLSTADTNAFSTNFSMLSFDMDEIAEGGGKPSQAIATNSGTLSGIATVKGEKNELLVGGSSKPADETDFPEEVIATAPESLSRSTSSPASHTVAQVGREAKPSTGRDYLLKMNRNETLGNAQGGESNRSRSLSPRWISPRTPSGKRKLRIKKEPNLNKDFLKAEFQKKVKTLVMLKGQFQQEALPGLNAEKTVDIKSISCSLSTLGDILDEESNGAEIRLPPMSENESGGIRLPPAPPISSMSPPLYGGPRKQTKIVRWELGQNLYRINRIPVYNQEEKKDCFYNEEEIKKFRFELHATDFDIHSIEDDMMADDIVDDMSFADEIVSDEDMTIELGSFQIESRRGSM
ncbi:MAG: hypothetical protein SGBAC_007693 [Bacillariaceae sp.]